MIQAQNIVLKKGNRLLLSALSFQLSKGACLELVGSNGCGKTSLLKLLARQHQSYQGQIQYNLTSEKPLYLGLISGFDPERSLKDNLCYLLALENLSDDNCYHENGGSRLDHPLSYLQLRHFKDLPYKVLSAGQKQRAHLMRLLLWSRTCWLLDEPNTSLDSAGNALLRELCHRHQRKGGSILITTPHPLGIGTTVALDVSTISSNHDKDDKNDKEDDLWL